MGGEFAGVLKLALVGALSALLYLTNFELAAALRQAGLIEATAGGLAAYPILFTALFLLYGLAALHAFRARSGPWHLGVILGFAILFRVTLLSAPLVLSSDLHRYVWDGRVQAAGINPYLHPPAAEELQSLRDERVFPFINRPNAPTIYPPGAQFVFALIHAAIPDSVTGMKAVMVLFDLATVGLLLLVLKRSGIAPERVVVYAWSPLVIFEIAGSGHAEALMLPFILLALLGRMEGRSALAGSALAAATLVKLYPAILLPALYRRGDSRFLLAFGATILMGYAPYLAGAGGGVLGFLPDYFGPGEDFNVGFRDFLAVALAPFSASSRLIAMLLVSTLLLVVALGVARDERRDVVQRGYVMVSAYLLLLPTSLHPWYLVWLVPFLCFHPSWGWLYFSGAISLSYVKYVRDVLPVWVWLAEFLPLYALLAIESARSCRHRAWSGAGTALPAEPMR